MYILLKQFFLRYTILFILSFVSILDTNCQIFSAIDTPLVIPDGDLNGITSYMQISNPSVIKEVKLRVNVEHTYVGDLKVVLSHIDTGKSVVVISNPNNCSGNNIIIELHDFANLSVQDDCITGFGDAYLSNATYKPSEKLNSFANEIVNGLWSLTVIDNAKGDTGSIIGWSLIVSSFDQQINNHNSFRESKTMFLSSMITSLDFSPDGKYLAAGARNGFVYIVNIATGQISEFNELHDSAKYYFMTSHVNYSSNGALILAGIEDALYSNVARVWDIETDRTILDNYFSDIGGFHTLAFSPDNEYIVLGINGRSNNFARVIHIKTKETKEIRYPSTEKVLHVDFLTNDSVIISTSKSMKTWDLSLSNSLSKINYGSIPAYYANLLPNKDKLISINSSVQLWDVNTGNLIKTFNTGPLPVFAVSISPDGLRFSTIHVDNVIREWDISSGELLHSLYGHEARINDIEYSPDGKLIASGSDDSTIKIWNHEDNSNRIVDHGSTFQDSTSIIKDTWYDGALASPLDSDWFSFSADANKEYMISLEKIKLFEGNLSVYRSSDLKLISSKMIQSPTNPMQMGIRIDQAGKYYISVRSSQNDFSGRYKIGVLTLSDLIKRAVEAMREDQVNQAFKEFDNLVSMFPSDPESNLYMAFLRLFNVVETPDQHLLNLLRNFHVQLDFFPKVNNDFDFNDSEQNMSDIQNYAVNKLLPIIDQSLHNLEVPLSDSEIVVTVPSSLVADVDDLINEEWYLIDSADVHIMAGATLIMKSMIYMMVAFNMDVAPKTLDKHFPSLDFPINFEGLLIENPYLLQGQPDIQVIIRSALQNWLLGSEKLRKGILKMKDRQSSQEIHIFYIELEEIDQIKNLLNLLDRVFSGLLMVSGGDFDGNTRVDYWDLHALQNIYR